MKKHLRITKQILPLFRTIRPVNVVITFFSSVVASIICLRNEHPGAVIFIAAVAPALTAAAGNIINDIADIEGDKTNHPERAVASGIISKKKALVFYFLISMLPLIITAFISFSLFVINLAAVLLLLLYSYRLKKIILAGNIVVSLLTGMVFIFGGIAAGNIYLSLMPAAFAFLINLIREIVKDAQDIQGDLKEGIITFPAKFGANASKKLVSVLCAVLFFAALLPLAYNLYGKLYGVLIIVLFEPVLFYIILLASKKDNNLSLNNISFLLKLNMIIGLTALYFGR